MEGKKNKTKVSKSDVKTTDEGISAAKRILELEAENAELLKKVELLEMHNKKVDPEVQVKYTGIRKGFVFRGHDFSKGACVMLKSQARQLIDFDPMCFKLV